MSVDGRGNGQGRRRARLAVARAAALAALAAVVPAVPAPAQRVDTATALGGLRDLRAACTLDGGAMWGRSLCGPMALVEPRTRLVLANDTVAGRTFLPYGDAWVGVLPAEVTIANTSFDWSERPWAMVALPLPRERFARAALLVHESLHRDQRALGFPRRSPASPHLEELDGRTWLRLELRALAAALEAGDRAARSRALDALAFRARRHARYPGADTLEAALEVHEGLPEYTGVALALRLTGEPVTRVVRRVREFESSTPSYARSFAYATGPALGLLLDRFDPAWRATVVREGGPGVRLARALRAPSAARLSREADRRGREYDAFAVIREEAARAAAHEVRLGALRARLVDGPLLVLTQTSLSTSFDPSALVPLGAAGTVYPAGVFTAAWGKLTVDSGGALISPDFTRLAVRAPPGTGTGRLLRGEGWALELSDGWTVAPSPTRRGSYEVRAVR